MFHAHLLRYALWRGLPALLNLATVTLLTTALPPSDYGTYALVLAGAALMNATLVSWAQQGLVRQWRLLADHAQRNELIASVVAGLAGAFAIGGLLVVLAGMLLPDGSLWRDILPFVPVVAAAQAVRLLLLEVGRARLRPDAFGALVVGNAIITAVGAPAAAMLTHDVRWVIAVLLAAELVPCMPLLWRSRARLAQALQWRHVQRSRLGALLRFGLPLTASSLLAQGLFAGTRAIVVVTLGAAAAGVYAAAYDLTQRAVTASMQLVSLGSVPLLLDATARGDEAERDAILRRNLVWCLIAGVPLALLFSLMSSAIAGTFLSSAYVVSAAACMPWVALGVLANRLRSNHTDLPFLVAGRTGRQLIAGAAGSVIGLAGTWWLAPRVGVVGAAMATSTGYVVALCGSWALGRSLLRLPWPARDLWRLALCLWPLAVLTVWQPARGVPSIITAAALMSVIGATIVLADVDGLRSMLLAKLMPRPTTRIPAGGSTA